MNNHWRGLRGRPKSFRTGWNIMWLKRYTKKVIKVTVDRESDFDKRLLTVGRRLHITVAIVDQLNAP